MGNERNVQISEALIEVTLIGLPRARVGRSPNSAPNSLSPFGAGFGFGWRKAAGVVASEGKAAGSH